MTRDKAAILFEKWCKKLRLVPDWDIQLEWVEDKDWRKTGDLKIDCTDKKAILLLNGVSPKQENLEEVIVHELMHLKLYPLDQLTEALITSNFAENTSGYKLAYTGFYETLEQTVEELTKCFLLEHGEHKDLSFGRCKGVKSFKEKDNVLAQYALESTSHPIEISEYELLKLYPTNFKGSLPN